MSAVKIMWCVWSDVPNSSPSRLQHRPTVCIIIHYMYPIYITPHTPNDFHYQYFYSYPYFILLFSREF